MVKVWQRGGKYFVRWDRYKISKATIDGENWLYSVWYNSNARQWDLVGVYDYLEEAKREVNNHARGINQDKKRGI